MKSLFDTTILKALCHYSIAQIYGQCARSRVQDGYEFKLRKLQGFFGSFNLKLWAINNCDSCIVGGKDFLEPHRKYFRLS